MCPSDEGGVYDPQRDTTESQPEQCRGQLLPERFGPVSVTTFVPTPPSPVPVFAVFLVAFVREHQSVLDTAATLQDVWVVGVIVPLANDVGRAEFEFVRERGGAGPLDVVLVVVGACILASHYIDFIEPASGAAYAFQLPCRLA